ncbi:DUF3558 domain-containing protein [Amycolatopsis rhabdoformis]|uniref:DUF3558 domain-containing protein n=1 Tax=Amycolatopsis rhabdoformis TaxID=1448059 RepID=A0ABZ1I3U6_9PSEU|nr:DUF3558 domain-containing protein [Amycolatopsis rhabdoformis]WSE28238.1 DUF3558 domain-containing protein [Amycolatopsis rhabdoformis]
MSTRKLLATVIAGLSAAAVSGCSSDVPGIPIASPASSAGLPQHGAPAVSNPLTTASVVADPCSAVTTDQVTKLGGPVRSHRVNTFTAATTCTWVFDDNAGTVAAGMDTLDKDGLSHLYALKAQNSGVTTFEPQNPILGYPAVVFANGGEGPGSCQLAVGLNNNDIYMVFSDILYNPKTSDSCGLATEIAKAAIQHLKAA